jgi:hypothetical protein
VKCWGFRDAQARWTSQSRGMDETNAFWAESIKPSSSARPERGTRPPRCADDEGLPHALLASLRFPMRGPLRRLPRRRLPVGGREEAQPISRLRIVTAALVTIVAAIGAASSASGASATSANSLVRAARIRAEVDARYPGLRVTEASSTAVIDSVTLFTAKAEPRVVPAENGIYFSICPIGATCPYPGRAARPPSAFAPRRLALELAVRTFLETEADLVLVSLPTPRFVLLVFERAELDASSISQSIGKAPRGRASSELRNAVDSTTLPRLFAPFALEPCPNGRDTLLALSLTPARPPASSGTQAGE